MDATEKIKGELRPQKFDRARAGKFSLERAKGSLASRSTIERVLNVDEENRTVDFSFASDKPIEHYFGFLILDTAKKSVILDRVTSGVCPHLVNHDTDKQVGVLLSDSVTLGTEVRGKVKFSRAAYAQEIFQDVVDEIRNGVSFGFLVHDLVLESDEDGVPTYRATKWEILETTTASIPADISVGMGREFQRSTDDGEELGDQESREKEEEKQEERTGEDSANNSEESSKTDADENRANSDDEENMTEEEKKAAERAARSARLQDFNEIGEFYKETELAREFELDGKTETELLAAIREKRTQNTPVPPKSPQAAAGAQNAEAEIRTMIGAGQLKAFRGEGGAVKAVRFGHFLSAALFASERSINFCRENGIPLKRAQSESDNESGGIFVPHEFENVLIDLRLEYGIFRRNANVVPMSSESKSRPRRKGGLKAYPIGAVGVNRRLKESKMSWDQVYLLAKKWGVLAKFEEELSEDAVISMADTLASEIAYAFTQVEDECGFYGDGSGDFHGITGVITKLKALHANVAYIAGLQLASGNEWAEITLADILGVVGRLPSFARNSGSIKWYCTSEFWATVLCKIALTAGGATTESIQGETRPAFLGNPVEFVEAMPHVQENGQIPLLYGNLAQAAMFGDRRGVTIKMTDSNDTDFENDLMAIKGTERFDINVHDVGNADADAKKRLAGPIVGLIMQNA